MPDRIRRMGRLEAIADDIVSYGECAEITLALLGLFKDALIRHGDDPRIVWEALTEMTGDTTRALEPLGYGIGWRMP